MKIARVVALLHILTAPSWALLAGRVVRRGAPLHAKKSSAPRGKGFGKARPDKSAAKQRASRLPEKDNVPCGCFSGLEYRECCKPYHQGEKLAESAEILVQARYCAFHYRLVEFIVDSTHPENELFGPRDEMIRRLDQQCYDDFEFLGLDIQGSREAVEEGSSVVDYDVKLKLKSDGSSTGFVEAATFKKKGGKWLYVTGDIKVYKSA